MDMRRQHVIPEEPFMLGDLGPLPEAKKFVE